ncbi:RHS repeat-associated core domain-containing protein, partial [Lachnoanaerobaculum saburreum]
KRGSQAIQSYVWDFNVAYMAEGEKEFTYLQDELGSTVRLLEKGGESQAIYGYDEFGEDTYNTQGKMQPFGYTGYRYDNVADTYFAQAREYVPKIGRFVGEDWIKGNIEKPFSLNQYGYCWGNPIGLVDRDGKHRKWLVTIHKYLIY